MEQRCIELDGLHRQELVALELDIRREILEFIGFELRRMREIGEELGLNDKELEDHLSLLEKALHVEQEEGCYRLTQGAKPTWIKPRLRVAKVTIVQ
jgi:predicted transcriptional regulator